MAEVGDRHIKIIGHHLRRAVWIHSFLRYEGQNLFLRCRTGHGERFADHLAQLGITLPDNPDHLLQRITVVKCRLGEPKQALVVMTEPLEAVEDDGNRIEIHARIICGGRLSLLK